jgi:hypothetical protein
VGRLREHDFEDLRCAECGVRDPVGPCAACESMICGDCGVLSKDPSGTRCICHSCARLVASVDAKRVERRPLSAKAIAWMLVLAFGLVSAVALLR